MRTRREQFLDAVKDEMFSLEEKATLRNMSDELFVEWVTHGGFHLGTAFHYFTLFFGFPGKCNISDQEALVKWLNERTEEDDHE